jgi:hypothetical protein
MARTPLSLSPLAAYADRWPTGWLTVSRPSRRVNKGKDWYWMEKRYYTAETLRGELDSFEAKFGCSSDAFYRAYRRDDSEVPGFEAVVWADTFREFLRLTGATPREEAPQPVH